MKAISEVNNSFVLDTDVISNPEWDMWEEIGVLGGYSSEIDRLMVVGLESIFSRKFYSVFRDEENINDALAEMIYTLWVGCCGEYGGSPRGGWLAFRKPDHARFLVAHVRARYLIRWEEDKRPLMDIVEELMVINFLKEH